MLFSDNTAKRIYSFLRLLYNYIPINVCLCFYLPKDGNNIGTIVGAVVGILLVLIIITVLAVIIYKR